MVEVPADRPETTVARPTRREMDALYLTVRHIGRAMASWNRYKLPDPPRFGHVPEWWLALAAAERALMEASNRLIDGLEEIDAEVSRG